MSGCLSLETRDHVAFVTIDRPERRNALDQLAMDELVTHFDRFDRDDEIWCVVITGSGDKAFSSGRDLKEHAARDSSVGPYIPMKGGRRYAFEVVYECRKPVVAGINGWALGGGLELAMACDLRVAAQHARMGLPEAALGLGANFGAAILPRLVPSGIANEMLYFGNPISAEEALRYGLVSRIFSSESFREDLKNYVAELMTRAPLAHRRFKAVAQHTREMPLSAALRLDPAPNPYTSEDAVEGITAFREKRTPYWQGH